MLSKTCPMKKLKENSNWKSEINRDSVWILTWIAKEKNKSVEIFT